MTRWAVRCVNCVVSLRARAHWLRTSWLQAAMSGVVRTKTPATTRRVTCRHTTRRCRCCCRTVSLASLCRLLRARGTITSWVCLYASFSLSYSVQICKILQVVQLWWFILLLRPWLHSISASVLVGQQEEHLLSLHFNGHFSRWTLVSWFYWS